MSFTALAGIFRSDMLENHEAGGDVFELLAGLLADLAAFEATFGASSISGSDVVDDPLARQARRQRLAAAVARGRRGRLRIRGWPRGWRLDDFGGEEEQLGGVDGLALLAEPLAEELLELVLEPGDEHALPTQGLGLLAELEVGGGQVVGE